MKLIITGSESFIGKELKRHCREKGIEWVGIDAVPLADPCHIQADIRSGDLEKAIPEGADAIVHLAAISRDQDCRLNPKLAFDVNVMGTLNLIQAARLRKAKQFIFASSEWVYGEVDNRATQAENQPIDMTKIRSEYALTKIVGEQNLKMAHSQDFCHVTILRFGIVYGPRPANWSAVETLFNAVRTQDVIEVGSLETARRFIHVSDIAAGILKAVGGEGCEIFNLSGDKLVTLREVISQSQTLLGRKPKVIEKNPAAISVRNPSNEKARRVLKWKPVIELPAGLKTLMEPAKIS